MLTNHVIWPNLSPLNKRVKNFIKYHLEEVMRVLLKTTIVILLCSIASIQAETRPLIEGTDYQVMAPKGSKTPEVLEFFSYACGHCYTMESFITQFKKDNNGIKVVPVPMDLGNPQWQIYVKAFYLGELLKVLDKSHTKLFHRVNIEKKPITKEKELKAFFLSLGVESSKYDGALKSFSLDAKIRKSKQLARQFQVIGTPTFVTNRRFKLDNRELGTTEMIEKALVDLTKTSL